MNFIVIIPARYASTRLPFKPLADINGKPMVVHVMEQARKSRASRVLVAVDHLEVAKVIEEAEGEICMTHSNHTSGIERISEVIERYSLSDDQIIVNVQGDEPMIPALILNQIAESMAESYTDMTTLAVPIKSVEEAFNPNVVKVVIDAQGYALYFSRAPIPWNTRRWATLKNSIGKTLFRHIGIYAYRASFVRRYVRRLPCQLEQTELLEQLRALWYSERVRVIVSKLMLSISVDTPEDLERVRNILR